MGLVTRQDPIGIAGGLNLYGYAGGDPINFSDPFGLCPKWLTGVPCGDVNEVKVAVGAVNVVRGVSGLASGGALIAGSAATTQVGPVALAATPVGLVKVAFGLGNLNG